MATFIHGIAASENIDTSGERLSIAGMDISSLDKDGVFNWEHKADQPAQVVGKILKAKKIFSEQDCEDDHQLYFWQKCQTPYVYVMGELMDDYKESAREVAGHFRYEADRDHEASTVNFSIEGGKMEKRGMDVLRSVARKVTITVLACNKATVAEMVTIEKRPKKGDINELFKTEHFEAELFSPMNKALTAGSANVAPSQLTGIAALTKPKVPTIKAPVVNPPNVNRPDRGFGKITHKPGTTTGPGKVIRKSQWLARAEQEYEKWTKRESFESFMSTRMPHLTKGEIKAIGQVMVLNKSMNLEKALAHISGYEPMEKAGGKDSIYTLILFEGCELHDILHCSHFATDAMNADTYEKIKEVCDKYFEKGVEAKELEFKESGELGKESQKVLFLTDGDPYKDLFDQLDKAAPYKYSKFRPHISVTSNVDEFKGKAASLVISVNGEVKQKYDFSNSDKIPGGLADKKSPSDFDPKKLAQGVRVELEHTSDPKIATEIAMDHLTEDPDYYDKLKKIEQK